MVNNIKLIKADFIRCETCAFSLIGDSRNEPTRFRLMCKRNGEHSVQEKCYCEYWEDKRQTATSPDYHNGTLFPHCPKCNEELDIKLAGDDSRDDYCIQPNYCYYCGQKIKWGNENENQYA
jgi:hypothetical protein